ncbi:MAG: hypothetical protein ACREQX_01875, partial [Candidatus Binataceae bacterium]
MKESARVAANGPTGRPFVGKQTNSQEENKMSARDEVQRMTEHMIAASAKGDFTPFLNALDDDLEVFDHVACRFDDKAAFLGYLQSVVAGVESTTFD